MAIPRETTLPRVLLFMLLVFLVVVMSPLVSILFEGALFETLAILVFFLTFALFYALPAYFVRMDGGNSIEELGIQWEDNTMVQIAIGAIAGTLAAVLVLVIAVAFGGETRPIAEMTGDLIIGEIIITTPTAFFEELVHRGYILPRLESLLTKSVAVVVSSLFFALSHFSWWLVVGGRPDLILIFTFNMFLGGVVLSLSYYISGRRLWVPIGFHFMWNMVAYVTFIDFPRTPVLVPHLFQIEWGVTTILGFLFGLSLVWGLWLSYGKKE
jgi:membrane protease YdiL (CAAX protease family)